MDDKEKTVGAILKEARLAKGISLADAEKATSIRSRYLQALVLRIERAEHDPKKDALKAERLQGAENCLREAERLLRKPGRSGQCRNCVREYEMLVEEFRISVFAPELGTRQPVSEKRLRQKWAEVESICRQVE